jgi:hypothetical protein
MGRRWWQKEARRIQNVKSSSVTPNSAVEEVIDDSSHFADADAVISELAETIASITTEDVAEVQLTAEEAVIEDAKDAEVPDPVKVVTQNNFSNNKKKRR